MAGMHLQAQKSMRKTKPIFMHLPRQPLVCVILERPFFSGYLSGFLKTRFAQKQPVIIFALCSSVIGRGNT